MPVVTKASQVYKYANRNDGECCIGIKTHWTRDIPARIVRETVVFKNPELKPKGVSKWDYVFMDEIELIDLSEYGIENGK